MGEIPVRIPKVRDRIGNGVKFNAALVPPFVRLGGIALALPQGHLYWRHA